MKPPCTPLHIKTSCYYLQHTHTHTHTHTHRSVIDGCTCFPRRSHTHTHTHTPWSINRLHGFHRYRVTCTHARACMGRKRRDHSSKAKTTDLLPATTHTHTHTHTRLGAPLAGTGGPPDTSRLRIKRKATRNSRSSLPLLPCLPPAGLPLRCKHAVRRSVCLCACVCVCVCVYTNTNPSPVTVLSASGPAGCSAWWAPSSCNNYVISYFLVSPPLSSLSSLLPLLSPLSPLSPSSLAPGSG